jgi:hypothetical protein
MSNHEDKTIKAEHLGMAARDAFASSTSAPRSTMSHKMQAQMPVLVGGGDLNNIITGAEEALCLTYDVAMPADGVVTAIISRYPNQVAGEWNKSLVIFQRNCGMYDCVELNPYFFNHNEFGFPYKPQEALKRLVSAGGRSPAFKAGDVFLDSPNRRPDGSYGNGRRLNVCAVSHPSVSDDAIGISRDVVDKFKYYTFRRNVIKAGADDIMLNLYGDAENYKCIPDLGAPVNDNCLLACTRSYRPENVLTGMSYSGLRRVDENSDTMFVVPQNSIVVDIEIIHNPNQATWAMPEVHEQIASYWAYTKHYYEKLQQFYLQYIAGAKPDMPAKQNMSDALSRNIREALIHLQPPSINRLHRAAPLPEWMVTITTMAINTPLPGGKFVGAFSADKGVVTFLDPEEMPVDKDGNRADMVMSPDAAFGRMTLGANREPAYNAASRDIMRYIKREIGFPRSETYAHYRKLIKALSDDAFAALIRHYEKFCSTISEETLIAWNDFNVEERVHCIANAFATDAPEYILTIDRKGSEIDRDRRIIQDAYPGVLVHDKVSWVRNGVREESVGPALIGSRMICMLEQTACDVSATASSTTQATGLTSHRSENHSYADHVHDTAIRVGNTEERVGSGASMETYPDRYRRRVDPPGTMIAELNSRNGSRSDHVHLVRTLLDADKPGAIENLVPRDKVPYGKVRAVTIYRALAASQGAEFIPEGDA